MLLQLGDLRNFEVAALDGELGRVREFYFDDARWVIRHFIVTTSHWLGRDVLIAPQAVLGVDPVRKRLNLNLSRQKAESSPSIDCDRPVSKREAEAYYGHYGWPVYWSDTGGFPGFSASLATVPAPAEERGVVARPPDAGDPHLRSFREVTGYHMRARDGEIGHLQDMLANVDDWTIEYLIVRTRNWLPGKEVLVLPDSVRGIDWSQNAISVDLGLEEIKTAPAMKPHHVPTAVDEQTVRAHYRRATP